MAVAKVTEIIASSEKSFEDAVRIGIARANKTLKNVRGAWVKEQKVVVERARSPNIGWTCASRSYSPTDSAERSSVRHPARRGLTTRCCP